MHPLSLARTISMLIICLLGLGFCTVTFASTYSGTLNPPSEATTSSLSWNGTVNGVIGDADVLGCQRKVEMSSFSQGRNVRLQGFLQGCSGGTWYLGLNSLGGCAFRFASPEGRRPEGLAKTGVGSGQSRRRR